MSKSDDLDPLTDGEAATNPTTLARLDAEVHRQRLMTLATSTRKANGLTQAAVAKQMGVSQSVVAEIEAGRTDIRYSTLDRYVTVVSKGTKRLDLVPV